MAIPKDPPEDHGANVPGHYQDTIYPDFDTMFQNRGKPGNHEHKSVAQREANVAERERVVSVREGALAGREERVAERERRVGTMADPSVESENIWLDHARDQAISAPSSATEHPLTQYKAYVIDNLPISAEQKTNLRVYLDAQGWPEVWSNLETIRACADGGRWEWSDKDTETLGVLREDSGLGWDVISGCFFVGMREDQCEGRYEASVRGE